MWELTAAVVEMCVVKPSGAAASEVWQGGHVGAVGGSAASVGGSTNPVPDCQPHMVSLAQD